MNKNYIILVLLLLIVPGSVMAIQGIAGQPLTYFTAPACYGSLSALVVNYTSTPYQLINCTQNDSNHWECPCRSTFDIITETNTTSHFNIRVQYYVGNLKTIPDENRTTPSADELYNENQKRVVNINDIILLPYVYTEVIDNTDKTDIGDFILFIFLSFLFIIFIIIIIIIIIYANSEKIKKRLGMMDSRGKDVDITFGQILKNIFSRPGVERKEVAGTIRKPTIKVEPKVNTVQTNNAQEEARKLLEELNE